MHLKYHYTIFVFASPCYVLVDREIAIDGKMVKLNTHEKNEQRTPPLEYLFACNSYGRDVISSLRLFAVTIKCDVGGSIY